MNNIIETINLKLLLVNALFITGLYYCCDYDLNKEGEPASDAKNIFWFIKWGMVKRNWPVWIIKPLCGCMMCMSSCYGLLFLLPSLDLSTLNFETILQIIIYCIALCGANRILYHFT